MRKCVAVDEREGEREEEKEGEVLNREDDIQWSGDHALNNDQSSESGNCYDCNVIYSQRLVCR